MTELNWVIREYDDLNIDELFEMYHLRQRVFIVEQDCAYQDCDLKDKQAFHVFAYRNKVLVGYLRILKPGVSYNEPSIGRVVVCPSSRGEGIGRILMKKGLEYTQDLFKSSDIRISAQKYLVPFYESLDFVTVGESYLEDGIPHIEMLYKI